MIFLFLFSYVLSLSGFLLGKSTFEEHKEIKKYVLGFSEFLKISFFFVLLYFFGNSKVLIFVILLICFYIGVRFVDTWHFKKFFGIIFLASSYLLFEMFFSDYLWLVLILIFVLVFENSFEKFDFKIEFLSFSVYFGVYVVFGLIGFLI